MHLAFGDVVEIKSQCYLLVGRHLNLAKREGDIANAIAYKQGNTLYLIDTGAVIEFGNRLYELCQKLTPFERIVLINTHGHGDHVGNNDILQRLEAKHKEHYISTHDIAMMRDQLAFFSKNFVNIEPWLNGKSAEQHVANLLEIFKPLNVDTPFLQPLESREVCDVKIGNIHWSGWNFNDDIYVMKSQGHSAGHVVVYIPEIEHIHMGDETNGYCNLFHDCDHLKSLESHTKTLSMLSEGKVQSLSDGHTFKLHNSDEAIAFLQSLISGHYIFSNFMRELLQTSPAGMPIDDIYNALDSSDVIKALPAGANPNPAFTRLQILSKFRDLGVVGNDKDVSKALFQFHH